MESLKTLPDSGILSQPQTRADAQSVSSCMARVGRKSTKEVERQELLNDTKEVWHDSGNETSIDSLPKGTAAYTLDKVSIAMPESKDILIKDLSLEIKRGHNLLITGATGSGKTSILRVLHGLFPILSGRLREDQFLAPNDVMFVPQKPFLTDGTLREQVIYPAQVSSLEDPDVTDTYIMEILDLVGLLHLFERIGSLDTEVDWNWNDVLTPGEMQCLSFARLYYTKPKFAFLDEATSAITVQQQNRFYSTCIALGTTLISIGHSESLRHFHKSQLVLQENGDWSLVDITNGES